MLKTTPFLFVVCVLRVAVCDDQNQPNDDQNLTNDDDQNAMDEPSVCFDHIGCFDMGPPWFSLLRSFPPPQPPILQQITAKFYSQSTSQGPGVSITLYPQVDLQGAPFDHNKVTAVMCHGFIATGNEPTINRLKNAYLSAVDGNVFVIDWGAGALNLSYLQAVSNGRVVGRIVAIMLNHLIQNHGLQPERVHLFGPNLAAHIMSYTANEVPGIGRLTAMDPNWRGFDGYDEKVRLDKSDAVFVDVVHTYIVPVAGKGIFQPVGHVDFYVNGGLFQPGCFAPDQRNLPPLTSVENVLKFPFVLMRESLLCSHRRAEDLIIEAYDRSDLTFLGRRLNLTFAGRAIFQSLTNELLTNWTDLHEPCTPGMCVRFGLETEVTTLRGLFIVSVRDRPPYLVAEPEEWGRYPPELDPTRSLNEV